MINDSIRFLKFKMPESSTIELMENVVVCELPTLVQMVGNWNQEIRQRAEELCKLLPGWDGNSGPAVDPQAVWHALTLAFRVTCPECLHPTMSPTSRGHVILDWTWGNDCVEIDVRGDGHLEGLIRLPDQEREFETNISHSQHLDWIAHQITGVGLSRLVAPPGVTQS